MKFCQKCYDLESLNSHAMDSQFNGLSPNINFQRVERQTLEYNLGTSDLGKDGVDGNLGGKTEKAVHDFQWRIVIEIENSSRSMV